MKKECVKFANAQLFRNLSQIETLSSVSQYLNAAHLCSLLRFSLTGVWLAGVHSCQQALGNTSRIWVVGRIELLMIVGLQSLFPCWLSDGSHLQLPEVDCHMALSIFQVRNEESLSYRIPSTLNPFHQKKETYPS